MKNLTMMTDFYELTMSQAYFKAGKKDEIAVFDAFFRKNPLGGGYGVMGGVDRIIDFIKNAHFSEEDIDYLRSTGQFTEDFLTYLKDFKFTGDLYAIPDGTPVFPNEPIITDKVIFRKLITYSIPFILIDVFKSLYNVIDMVTVVKGLVEYAKYSVSDAETIMSMLSTWSAKFNMIVLSVSTGVVVSLIPNLTSSFVKNDMKDVNKKIRF